MKKIISFSLVIVGFFLGATALSALAQSTGTWTPPQCSPPNCNTPAPINVGSSAQAKTGLLGLSNFLFLPPGMTSVMPGSVLIASTTGDGLVTWGVPSQTVPTDASLTTNGWQVFPSGLILEWGVITTNSTYNNNPKTQSFPKTFPNAVFSITVTAGQRGNGSGDKQSQWGGRILNTSQFQYYAQYENPDTGPFNLYWMAIGW